MKHFVFKLLTATFLGLGCLFSFMGLMNYLHIGLQPAQAADLTVCPAGPPTCSFTSVQYAVDAAVDGDVIKVAAGTYTDLHTRNQSLFGNPLRPFTQVVILTKSLTIKGGYTSDFTDPPDPTTNHTILDAQGRGRVLFSYHQEALLGGLQFTGGNAQKGGAEYSGSGSNGGGLLLLRANTVLSDNIISHNQVTDGSGGGLFASSSSLTIVHNLIYSNSAFWGGGGLGIVSSTAVLISNNHIVSNSAQYGGGVDLEFGYPQYGNVYRHNTANYGGGLYTYWSGNSMVNNIFADNHANIQGAGIYFATTGTELQHTTIARNSGGDGVGIYVANPFFIDRPTYLTNTIIVSQSTGIFAETGLTVTLDSTLWYDNQTDWAGPGTVISTNNHYGEPTFLDPDAGDYHLGFGSMAIDKGIPTAITTDIDGDTRPTGAAFDIGADEYQSMPQLTISKTGPFSSIAGASITYTLSLTNNSDLTATNTTITDTIPDSATYLSGGTRVGNVVSWIIPSLAPGGGLTQTSFVVSASQTITNDDYGARSAEGVTTQGTNPVVTIITTTQHVDLEIDKRSAPNPHVPGETITYTIVVTNNGPSTIGAITVKDNLPVEIQSPSYDTSEGTFNSGTGLWNISNFATGDVVTVTINGIVDPSFNGTLVNTAIVTPTGGIMDSDPTNNIDIDQSPAVSKAHFLPVILKH